ncbi:MAG TPA: TRAM domain-containing protein [Actinobacteria bacterium]|nr:TRAM domain-containing protein [Actinomycetota bacterium]
MITEIVRLFVTLAMTGIGFQLASGVGVPGVAPELATVWGAVLGAGIGYVVGGVLGRRARDLVAAAPGWFSGMSAAQVLIGGLGVAVGTVVGAAAGAPLVALLPAPVGWPLAIVVVVLFALVAGAVFAAKADDVTRLSAGGFVRGGDVESGGTVVDSSAAIDGRVLELSRSGLLGGPIVVPEFVLGELQAIADSRDRRRRRAGRRGLEILEALRSERPDFVVVDDTVPDRELVDDKLMAIAERRGARLVTTDHNLARAAGLRGIAVLNPHTLGEALRPILTTGERVEVLIAKEGTEDGQGVGYLDDGTMVVVADAADSIGTMIEVEISNVVRTSMGRMLFARPAS